MLYYENYYISMVGPLQYVHYPIAKNKRIVIREKKRIYFLYIVENLWDFPGSSASKESACNWGDPGSFLGGEDPLEKG